MSKPLKKKKNLSMNEPPTNEQVREALRTVNDPELGYSIVDLGLVYGTSVTPDGTCEVTYTLTSPACPLGDVLEENIRAALRRLPDVTDVRLELVFDPPWGPEKITTDLRRELRLQGMAV